MAKAAEKAAETKKQRQNKAKVEAAKIAREEVEAESFFGTELPSGLGSTTHALVETSGQSYHGTGPHWGSLISCSRK
jgi:hypothetical protein